MIWRCSLRQAFMTLMIWCYTLQEGFMTLMIAWRTEQEKILENRLKVQIRTNKVHFAQNLNGFLDNYLF